MNSESLYTSIFILKNTMKNSIVFLFFFKWRPHCQLIKNRDSDLLSRGRWFDPRARRYFFVTINFEYLV